MKDVIERIRRYEVLYPLATAEEESIRTTAREAAADSWPVHGWVKEQVDQQLEGSSLRRELVELTRQLAVDCERHLPREPPFYLSPSYHLHEDPVRPMFVFPLLSKLEAAVTTPLVVVPEFPFPAKLSPDGTFECVVTVPRTDKDPPPAGDDDDLDEDDEDNDDFDDDFGDATPDTPPNIPDYIKDNPGCKRNDIFMWLDSLGYGGKEIKELMSTVPTEVRLKAWGGTYIPEDPTIRGIICRTKQKAAKEAAKQG